MAPIDAVPLELLNQVHGYFQNSPISLQNCALVCRAWHNSASPLLYGNIVLKHSNIARFIRQFNIIYRPLVQWLTLRFDPDDFSDGDKRVLLLFNIDKLSEIIGRLSRLSSFSFCLSNCRFASKGRLSHDTLITLLDALPESVVNLEIDTGGVDALSIRQDLHLCSTIRRLLPRMKHVRLRLHYMCSSLFGEGNRIPRPDIVPLRRLNEPFRPIAVPNLQTLVINCIGNDAMTPDRCDVGAIFLFISHPSQFAYVAAWNSVTEGLRLLVETGQHLPSAKFCLIRSLPDALYDKRHYASLTCAEMVSKTAHVYPYRSTGYSQESNILRTLDGRELVIPDTAVPFFAEGELWRSTVSGARLPASLLTPHGEKSFLAENVEQVRLPVQTSASWKEATPGFIFCDLWDNEAVAGTRLLEAEVRGPQTYLSDLPVFEGTPAGFMRKSSEFYRKLHRDPNANVLP